jgi:hypothetical protein
MGTSASRSIVYIVTCASCGNTWQRKAADDGQSIDCTFCGHQGRLRVGMIPQVPLEWGGTLRVEARLQSLEPESEQHPLPTTPTERRDGFPPRS